MELKQKASSLRQQGHTYPEISQALGVSVDWCKRNLKGIRKERVSDDCIMELIQKSTRPEGITVYEANSIIFKHNKDKALTKDQVKNIRKKAVYADNNCLFRPAWLDATQPDKSYKSILAYTVHMIDELENVTRWYCDTYPSVNKGAVQYEILKHLFPQISGEPLTGRIMRTENIVEILSTRNIESIETENEINLDSEDTIKTQTDLHLTNEDLQEVVFIQEEDLDDIWR